jgi:flagellar hook assembly protein FlgD
VEVALNEFPRLRLGPAVPNPLHGETKLGISGSPASVHVIDASGRRVTTLSLPAGATEIVWTATDDRGRRVPAGVYFIEAVAGNARVTRRVLVLP